MKEVFNVESISQMHELMGVAKEKHPLVSIVDYCSVRNRGDKNVKYTASFYNIFLKNPGQGTLKYGRQNYDFQEGTLVFIAPNQVIETDYEIDEGATEGWGLAFHPDFLKGSSLGSKMKEYSFFSYEANEGLHVSDSEKRTLKDIIQKIDEELSNNIDKHSQSLIISNIELLLNYCLRFYDRQFITRKHINSDILSRFELLLSDYFNAEKLKSEGLPSVNYCAQELNLSPKYLSDLLKKETGKNTLEHIHYNIIEKAKEVLLITSQSVSEIAYDLGFEYPQYFSKMFKKKTGMTPSKYRIQN